jgi:hypothetical protein
MLLVPDTDGQWANSLEFAYKFTQPNTALRDYVRAQMRDEQSRVDAQILVADSQFADDAKATILSAIPSYLPEHDRLVASYAPLAAVDGALVISKHLEIIGFGAKIVSPKEVATHVVLAGPQTGSQTTTKAPVESTGGTRHQSAARFVGANHDAVAMVVSHDRHTSFMFWEDDLQQVVDTRNIDWWE